MRRIRKAYSDEQFIALTKELTEQLRKSRTIDWQRKESARASMRIANFVETSANNQLYFAPSDDAKEYSVAASKNGEYAVKVNNDLMLVFGMSAMFSSRSFSKTFVG